MKALQIACTNLKTTPTEDQKKLVEFHRIRLMAYVLPEFLVDKRDFLIQHFLNEKQDETRIQIERLFKYDVLLKTNHAGNFIEFLTSNYFKSADSEPGKSIASVPKKMSNFFKDHIAPFLGKNSVIISWEELYNASEIFQFKLLDILKTSNALFKNVCQTTVFLLYAHMDLKFVGNFLKRFIDPKASIEIKKRDSKSE